MATTVQRLARWARNLTISDLPASVVERARAQHLSAAGAVYAVKDRPVAKSLRRLAKASGGRGPAGLVGGGKGSRRDAVRLHAGLSVWLDHDDYLFMGHTSHGAVTTAWAYAKGHTIEELLCATVAANEIAGRVGASMLLGPNNGQGWAPVTSVAAAVTAGLLEGLDEEQLAHAIALSVSTPIRIPDSILLGGGETKAMVAAVPAVQGLDAALAAKAGLKGSLNALDARDGILAQMCWVPLRNAFSGLGTAWLTNTLAFKLRPGCAYIQVPVEAFAEILSRHVKAAGKRLRVDQLLEVEVASSAPGYVLDQMALNHGGFDPAAVPFSVRRSIGVLMVAHQLTPTELESGWLAKNLDLVEGVARRVEVVHDCDRTMSLVSEMVDVAAPLLAGVSSAELRRVGKLAKESTGVEFPRPGVLDILSILKHRPGQLLERIRYSSGDLADAKLDEWQYRFDAQVVVKTSRGGAWPNQVSIPPGSPGCAWQETLAGVEKKFSAGCEHRSEVVGSIKDMSIGTDGIDWVSSLLS